MRPRATSRGHIDDIALKLFLDRGYPNVTTDDLIRACGVSRPTFFRYVTSRDALVLDHIAAFGEEVAGLVRENDSQHAWEVLREAMCGAIESLDPHSRVGMAFRILQESPGIRSSALELTRTWRSQLTEALVGDSHYDGDAQRCEAAAAMAIGLFQMTWARPRASTKVLRNAFNEAPSLTTARPGQD
ncbi:MAG: TetR/AcrR family transcriptional regulator [Brevibacterium sp.]